MLVVMVNIMCQLDWAMGPDIWLDIISGPVGVFPDEVNPGIHRLGKANCPLQRGSYPLC